MDKTVTFGASGKGKKPSGIMRKNTDFGPYQVLEHLDRGGMGDVYKARHNKLERIVALKVLPIVLSSDEFLERFNSEAFAISRLQHQNVVTIYDYGEINHRRFIAMQYIEGTTLTDLLEGKKKLSYGQIIDISKQICRGLQSMHAKGIIHRDIKSSNVMIDEDHRAFISDFGIAQTAGETRLTTTGMAMGTPEYMSPEQCQGKDINHQTDIYSFGILLYEMITGSPPFMGENPLSIAYKQVHENPLLLSKVKAGVPPRLELIVAKCLKKNKEERYQNISELLHDMDSIHNASSTSLTPTAISTNQNTATVNHTTEQRITDRRGTDRRNITGSNIPYLTFILPALILVLLVVWGTLQLSSSFANNTQQSNGGWVLPDAFTIPSPLQNPDPEAITFIGQGFSMELIIDKKNPGSFTLEFDKMMLVEGVAFEGTIQVSGTSHTPEKLNLVLSQIVEGKIENSTSISHDSLPQILNIEPTLGKRFEFEVTIGKNKGRLKLSGPVIFQMENVRVLGSRY